MITRSTLYSCRGGDTVQVLETAQALREVGVEVDILLTTESIGYERYSLLHFFNIIRPADILYHITRSQKPYVVSTIFVDYAEYDSRYRGGIAGFAFRYMHGDAIEYCKTIARRLRGGDVLRSLFYLLGHRRSVLRVLSNAGLLLPNSNSEYQRLRQRYPAHCGYKVITNGINHRLFCAGGDHPRDPLLVICVARIEGIKNQINLIKALDGTAFRLVLIGAPAPNQMDYYNACRKAAGANVCFAGHLSQSELLHYYQRAQVHVLPSWFETTGLSSLEAAAMGCHVVMTEKGDAKEYFGELGFYCDPGSPASIRSAIEQASRSVIDPALAQQTRERHTWQRAAQDTKIAYEEVLSRPCN